MTNSIEKAIDLAAPVDRVWRALTDHVEFGQWFGVSIEAPFAVGKRARGRITSQGHKGLVWEVGIVAMEEPERFAFTWHPYAVDPEVDYSKETPTLVEFRLEPSEAGTRLTVTESGFDAIPMNRRSDAVRMNDSGWAIQVRKFADHVAG